MKKPHKLLSLLCCVLSVGIVTFSACGLLTPSQETPSNNNGSVNNTGNNSTENNTNYSKILDTVVNDEYYCKLVDGAKNGTVDTNSGYFDPHPYGFLDDEGYDIAKIKNGTLECLSNSYLANDGYYIQTMVEHKNSTADYYGCYILKYSLSDTEKAELDDMFTDGYIQAPLYIQEISNQKTAEVVSEAYISKTAYANIFTAVTNNKKTYQLLGTSNIDFMFLNRTADDLGQHYDIQVYVRNAATTLRTHNGKVGQIRYSSTSSDKVETLNGNLVLINNPERWNVSDTNQNSYENSIRNVTSYNCQSVNLSKYSALENNSEK